MNHNEQHIDIFETIAKVLATEASDDQISWVKQWRESSEENEKEFRAIEKLWNHSNESTQQKIDIDSEWKVQKQKLGWQTRVISLKRSFQIAASVTIITMLSIFGLNQLQIETIINKSQLAHIVTQTLPDGSVVDLNKQSKITYNKDFGTTNRELKFKGEGFFEVQKNNNLPFKINTRGLVIEVVGTAFNVESNNRQTEIKITVVEGIVKVYRKGEKDQFKLIQAGETGRFDLANKVISKSKEQNVNDYGWKTRYLDFVETPLHDAVKVIENVYPVKIQLDDKIKDCNVTVTFENQTLETVLNVLSKTLDLRIQKKDDKFIITGDCL